MYPLKSHYLHLPKHRYSPHGHCPYLLKHKLQHHQQHCQTHHQYALKHHHGQDQCGMLTFAKMLILSVSITLLIATAEGNTRIQFRKWIHKSDPTHDAAESRDFSIGNYENPTASFDIDVLVSNQTLEVQVDGKTVMHKYNETTPWAPPNAVLPSHRGVGVVVLHPSTGNVMLTAHYETGEPRAYKGLIETLKSLQAGRILILAAPGDWRNHMNEIAIDFLDEYLGGWWVSDVCRGEMWVGVGIIDGPMWAEAATTGSVYTNARSSPLHVAITVKKDPKEEQRCKWYADPNEKKRAKFCENFEGYGDFCSCNAVKIISPVNAPWMEMNEEIPIVMITARHQIGVLRQIQQLWSQAGGNQTPILLSVDGLQKEARDFAEVLGLRTIHHINPAALGTLGRINQHIMFSLYQGFKLHPQAKKVILLEDDLLISPDFIRFFHQTAPLLDADDSILCVNAYNYNSFLPSALNTSKLYREEVFPAYGWMTTRKIAEEILPEWAPFTKVVDWDWYLRGMLLKGRTIVTPEVPRTYHNGHGGFHVTGWEQETYFDRRPLNTDPSAVVDISYLTRDAYEAFLEEELRTATILELNEHPCEKEYIPKRKVGSFVIYFHGETEKDDYFSYYTLVTCFNGYERGRMEHHRLMYTFGYYGNSIYLIACPGSSYCRLNEKDYSRLVYNASQTDLRKSIDFKHKTMESLTLKKIYLRTKPTSFLEEVTMQNVFILDTKFVMPEFDKNGKLLM